MRTVTLNYDQSELVVIGELMEAIDLNLINTKDEGGALLPLDHELVDSLVNVLKYFAPNTPEMQEYYQDVTKKQVESMAEFGR